MPETPDGSVRLALGEYPLGTTVAHHKTPNVKWRVLKQVIGGDGQVETVTLQRVGGKLNKSTADASANCVDYVAEPGRSLSRKLARAVQNAASKAAAAAAAAETDVVDTGVSVGAPPTPVAPKPRTTKPKTATTVVAAADPKPPAKRRAPATTKPKAKSDRVKSASQVRGAPTVPISEVKLDPRNPFEYSGRMHGYFQALLDGDGKATYGELLQSCIKLSEDFGITDEPHAIQRDLNNQTWNWQQGKWGLLVTKDDSMCQKTAGGHPTKKDRDRVLFTCVEVQGVPWADIVGRRRGS